MWAGAELRRAAVKGRFWRILHIQLNALRNIITAQGRRYAKRRINARSNACRADHRAILNHACVYRDCPKEGKQMVRRPVAGGALSLEQACRPTNQRTSANRKDDFRGARFSSHKLEHFFVLHHDIHASSSRHN